MLSELIRRRISHRPVLAKIVANIGWLFFDKILRMGVGLFVGVWLARHLGPASYGTLNFAMAFTAIFGAIAGLGLMGVVVRDLVRKPQECSETLGSAAVLLILGGWGAYLFTLASISVLRPEDLVARVLVAIVGSGLLFKVGEIAAYWFESQVMSKYLVWTQTSVFLLFAAIKVILIVANASIYAFAWALMMEALVMALLTLVTMVIRVPHLMHLTVSRQRTRRLLSSSWPVMLSGAFVLANMSMDRVVLMEYIGPYETGLYAAAYSLMSVFYFMPVVVGASIMPLLTEKYGESGGAFDEAATRAYLSVIALATVISLLLWFGSELLVTFLFGDDYTASIKVLQYLCWGLPFVSMASIRGRVLIVRGRFRSIGLLAFVGLITNVVLLVILVPRYGAVGAGLASCLSWIANCLIYIAFTVRNVPVVWHSTKKILNL